MQTNREKVIRVIRVVSEALKHRFADEAPIDHVEDTTLERAALVMACELCGISLEDYRNALSADPSLAELEKESKTEAVAGSTDPGPYDEISRESPSGQPGDLTKPRSTPRRAAPGGS